MDPNLEKIRDYHLDAIKAGRVAQPIQEAKDYLYHILGPQNAINIMVELQEFADNIKEIRDGQEG